jgi:hypothetical protein
MENRIKLNRIDRVFMLSLIAFVFVYSMLFINFSLHPIEDAAITMRYAQNFSNGHGIVWNIGENHIDGATDFLFMIVLAVMIKTGVPIEIAARSLEFIAHLSTVILVYFAIRKLYRTNEWLSFFCGLFIAIGPGLRYTQAFFSTPVFAFLVCLTWYSASQLALSSQPSSANSLLFAVSSLVTALIRPEGALLAGFMLIAIIYIKGIKDSKKIMVYFLLFFVIMGAIYFCWRWYYFGYPLPNPFYKKGGGHIYVKGLLTSISNTISLGYPFAYIYLFGAVILALSFLLRSYKAFVVWIIRIATSLFLLYALARRSQPGNRNIFGRYSFQYFKLLILLIIIVAIVIILIPLLAKKIKKIFQLRGLSTSPFIGSEGLFSKILKHTIFALIPVAGFTFIWIFLSDEMNYMMRFQYATLPIVLISWPPILYGFFEIFAPLRINLESQELLASLKIFVALCLIFFLWNQHSKYERSYFRDGRYEVAMMLREYSKKNYTLATAEAGLLPLYSNWRSVDTWGLNDSWIAHHGLITESYLDLYKPEIIMFHDYFSPLTAFPQKDGGWFQMVNILRNYAEKNNYILAAAYGDSPYETHYYYVKTGFRDSQEILRKIRELDYTWVGTGKKCLNYALLTLDKNL